jgi:protein SCO1
MRLTGLQKILWAAAGIAVLAYGMLLLLPDRAPTPAAEAAFRPTFALPDADGCPTTLAEVAQVMDDLRDKAANVQPLFISVDPERDRKLGLAEFTTAFHPSILGLAGDAAQTRAAADSFKIYFEREDDAASPDGYMMSHSPALYLIGPDGDWLRQFTYGTPAADIVADLQSRL